MERSNLPPFRQGSQVPPRPKSSHNSNSSKYVVYATADVDSATAAASNATAAAAVC